MIENKYKKIYFSLIEKRKTFPLVKGEGYCETHHIVPRSMGGSDDDSNLVNLTAREHYIAHKLLTKITEGQDYYKMMWAMHRMVYGNTEVLSSKGYDVFRKKWSEFIASNHPSRTCVDWAKNLSDAVTQSWVGASERKWNASVKMKELTEKRKREDLDGYYEEQRKRAKVGAQKSKELLSTRIEYNGDVYLGWNDFTDKTGISKHLYRKFYLNGIDPAFRVGKDGPMDEKEIVDLVEDFCYTTNDVPPVYKEDAVSILNRMVSVGLLTKAQSNRYLETLK